MAARRPALPVARALRPAHRRRAARGPPAVRPPARAGEALRLPRQRRPAGRRALHARLLPPRAAAARGERHPAAALRGSDPRRRRKEEAAHRTDQRALPHSQRLHRGGERRRLRRAPAGLDGNVRADGQPPRHRRRARRHHPPGARAPASDRRRLPARRAGLRQLPRAPARPLHAGEPADANAPLRHPRPLHPGVRARGRADAARPLPHLYGRCPHHDGAATDAALPAACGPGALPAGGAGGAPTAEDRAALHRRPVPRHRQGARRRPLGSRRRRRRAVLPAPRPRRRRLRPGGVAGARALDDVRHGAAQGHRRPGRRQRVRKAGRKRNAPGLPLRPHRRGHQRHQSDAVEQLA